ncbi:MAG TPA: type I DNA topoisomerase, partial [Candidatus Saccharimonadales bacterium]|nr:type I DNA topoisomerase [Candidatus Saccharimonadales bacterium]
GGIIVESPAKAKTIEKYLGSDFTVLSSVGHIRSIAKKTKDNTPPIDVKNGYSTTYEIDSDKKKIISALKKAVATADTVWLATDEDREGEAIAWHLAEVLKLNPKTTKRIVFHEITKNAIEEAIKKPRTIDMDLVRAQQARQILDRLVGFELSPVVWRKVPGGKSAGRVQSPAVRLLVEREREIESFDSTFSFKVIAEFTHEGDIIRAELPHKFDTEPEAKTFLESLIGATFTVSDITTSPATRNPAAPFTTSTLQQDANSRLSFSARATMSSAQKLYQEGKITYMRTDSMNLSGQAIAMAADYIKSKFGNQYSQVRAFKTKSANAQEAHEAIRPTDMRLERGSSNEYDQKLYDLIRRRTLASQMAPAKLEKTVITIKINNNKYILEAKGEVIIFDGFLRVYGGNKKDAEILPSVKADDILSLNTASARQVFARPPARYSEGSLVKKLEELGIGRPSTYATIINTVQVRGYAEKGESEGNPRNIITLNLENNVIKRDLVKEKTGSDRGKLVPTATGEIVSDFLTNHFEQIVDYGFTATVEAGFDKIATGALARNTMLDDFYIPFHELIEGSGDIDRSSVAKAREIGIDPVTNKPVLARFGRYGPMLQLGSGDNKDDKPQFAPIPAGRKIETVTLEEALYAFKLPRTVGQTPDGAVIKANIGRFGPYIQINKLFIGIKPLDPHTITLDEALALYNAKLVTEAEKNIADFGDGIKVLKGRFGPYITDGSKNAKVPKGTEPTSITKEQAKELLKTAPAGKKRRFTRKVIKSTTKRVIKTRRKKA